MSVDCSQIYKGPELELIQRYGFAAGPDLSSEQAHKELLNRKFRAVDPVVVLCDDGVKSKRLADELGDFGFINCFFVEGGFAHLQRSIRESKSF